MQANSHWYKSAVIYQIYPRSFKDSNGDGVGDLLGIISKLDYLKQLGIDGIWLSPVYPSPMKDFGYDVSNYHDIDAVFGDLEVFDRLINDAHSRGIRVIMDLVLNHTSDQHQWFLESKSTKDNSKRDWYIWRDPAPDGSPPNNWQSDFGGSAWALEPDTNQYYLHSFLKEQPDLNWANPEVQMSIQQVMRFWYERGVDGFRVDAILFSSKNLDIKRTLYRQKAHEKDILAQDFSAAFNRGADQHLREYIDILSSTTKEYPGRCLFLEAYPDPEREDPLGYAGLYEYFDNSVDQVFYFGMLSAIEGWEAKKFKYYVNSFQSALKPESTPAYVLGNHDRPRVISRIGEGPARAAALALLALPGAKFMYYGDEIGMKNVDIPLNQQKDPSNVNRDMARTPMQWSTSEFAGFSDQRPWLPVHTEYMEWNVEVEDKNESSLLNLYRRLNKVRRDNPALLNGKYFEEDIHHDDVFAFRRQAEESNVLVLINFSSNEIEFETQHEKGKLILSNKLDLGENPLDLKRVRLRPDEGWLVDLSK